MSHSATIAEVTSLHDTYEKALVDNDFSILTGLFWDSPQTIRYGVNEHHYGAAAITDFRKANRLVIIERKIIRREVTAFGPDTACVMCEIAQTTSAGPRHLRQSQLWIRFPEIGWKITSAHVSITPPPAPDPWTAYALQAARALDLPLAAEHLPGTALQLARSAAIAAPLLAHPLPASVERAAIFTP